LALLQIGGLHSVTNINYMCKNNSVSNGQRNLPVGVPDDSLCRALSWEEWDEAENLLKFNNKSRILEYISPSKESVLHRACFVNAPRAIFRLILEANPRGVLAQNAHGATPLHRACRKLPDEKILMLVDACPDATRTLSKRTDTVLHLAVWERRSENVIRTIMEAYPAACLIRNYGTGATPLYLACERSPDEKIIQMLLEACPEAASVRSGGGRVPLHIAVWKKHAPSVIRALLEVDPSLVVAGDNKGDTPIHTFVSTWAEVVNEAWKKRYIAPSADLQTNETDYQMVINVCEILLRAEQDKVNKETIVDEKKGKGEWLALHASIQHNLIPWEFVHLILLQYPEQAKQIDQDGNSTLHLLCASNKAWNEAFFHHLIKSNPGALEMKNNRGQTPFQIASSQAAIDALEKRTSDLDLNLIFNLLVIDPCSLRA